MSTRSGWQRARRPEEKEQRREEILRAAAELLDETGLEGAGLNAIARRAGISKANIYRYFESREAVLIQMLLTEVEEWMGALGSRLQPLAGSNDVDAIAAGFAATIAQRPRLCVLLGSLASVLEHNVSVEFVADFKRRLFALLTPMLGELEAAVPEFNADDAYRFASSFTLAACGAWPHCHPSPVVEEVLSMPEFSTMRLEFEETMRFLATVLLRGMLAVD